MNATAFAAAVAGDATANAITSDSNVDNSGTALHFRLKNNAGTVILQGTCGAGSGDLSFNTVSFIAGGIAAITSLHLIVPQ